jgi:hypothetical protein
MLMLTTSKMRGQIVSTNYTCQNRRASSARRLITRGAKKFLGTMFALCNAPFRELYRLLPSPTETGERMDANCAFFRSDRSRQKTFGILNSAPHCLVPDLDRSVIMFVIDS